MGLQSRNEVWKRLEKYTTWYTTCVLSCAPWKIKEKERNSFVKEKYTFGYTTCALERVWNTEQLWNYKGKIRNKLWKNCLSTRLDTQLGLKRVPELCTKKGGNRMPKLDTWLGTQLGPKRVPELCTLCVVLSFAH